MAEQEVRERKEGEGILQLKLEINEIWIKCFIRHIGEVLYIGAAGFVLNILCSLRELRIFASSWVRYTVPKGHTPHPSHKPATPLGEIVTKVSVERLV